MRKVLLGAVAVIGLVAGAQAADPIKIGVLVTLEGPLTVPGEDGVRGFKMAIAEAKATVAGRPIEYVIAPTDATPDTAVRQARRLIEQDGVDFIVGPLSGSEGIALRNYAKTIPEKTVINGISGALETTYVDPAPNFFRFNLDGAQWGVGLGKYVVEKKGWTKVASVAADYSFGYTNFMGFALDFCAAGGEIVERFWVPLGSQDFASVIAALPDDVDAIYLGFGGGDAINFLNQYQQVGGDANLIGGTIMADNSVLAAQGKAKDALLGTPNSGPQATDYDGPEWQAYVKRYQAAFPAAERFPSPSLFATGYYNATNAALQALASINGDLSDGHKKFHAALASLELKAPNGTIKLDANRQAIGTNYVLEVKEGPDGMVNGYVAKAEGVTQTLGLSAEAFAKIGLPSRTAPDCVKP